jgi:hypothetical protein
MIDNEWSRESVRVFSHGAKSIESRLLAGDGDRFRLRLLYLQANWKRIGDGELA